MLFDLTVSDLSSLQVVSKSWNAVIMYHEDTVYRTAAGYPPAVSLSTHYAPVRLPTAHTAGIGTGQIPGKNIVRRIFSRDI